MTKFVLAWLDWGERRGVGGGKGKVGLSERKICRCYTKGYITDMI